MALKAAIYIAASVAFLNALIAGARDPDPLFDICVADLRSAVRMNGYPCRDPMEVTARDFLFSAFRQRANVSNPYHGNLTLGNVRQFPALNTQGIATARLDIDVGGVIPPNIHPRSAQVTMMIQGSMLTGFVTPDNRLFANIVHPGDVTVYPRGAVHFHLQVGPQPVIAFLAYNSQFPGLSVIPNALFSSGMPRDVIAKSLFLDQPTIDRLQNVFAHF